jgi:hypothetical protein
VESSTTEFSDPAAGAAPPAPLGNDSGARAMNSAGRGALETTMPEANAGTRAAPARAGAAKGNEYSTLEYSRLARRGPLPVLSFQPVNIFF